MSVGSRVDPKQMVQGQALRPHQQKRNPRVESDRNSVDLHQSHLSLTITERTGTVLRRGQAPERCRIAHHLGFWILDLTHAGAVRNLTFNSALFGPCMQRS